LAVATVTVSGFATCDSWSERPVLDMLTTLLRVRLQISADMVTKHQSARFFLISH